MTQILRLVERYFVGACSVSVMGLALLPQLPAVVGEPPPAPAQAQEHRPATAVRGGGEGDDEGVVEPWRDRRREPVVVVSPNQNNTITVVGMLIGMVMGLAKIWSETQQRKQLVLSNRDRIVEAEGKMDRVENKVDQLDELMAVAYLKQVGDLMDSDLPKTVLIVEDDLPAARAYERILSANGFLTKHAADVPRALALLDAGPIHAVLLDLMLAGPESGEKVLLEIRRRELPVRVVINTATVDLGRQSHLLPLADVWLSKPRDIPRLVAALLGPTGPTVNSVATTDDRPPPKAV